MATATQREMQTAAMYNRWWMKSQESVEELECEVVVIRTQVENIIYMCESDYEREAIVNYAKHMLTDINSVLEVGK